VAARNLSDAMLFAYNEDGTLEVVADIDDARRHFQRRDVESGAIRLFDAAGNSLRPVFPHRTERKILGVRLSEDPGPYDLVAKESAASESFESVLQEANVLMPNPWFADLAAVRSHFERRR
jgi:hypothetical protein